MICRTESSRAQSAGASITSVSQAMISATSYPGSAQAWIGKIVKYWRQLSQCLKGAVKSASPAGFSWRHLRAIIARMWTDRGSSSWPATSSAKTESLGEAETCSRASIYRAKILSCQTGSFQRRSAKGSSKSTSASPTT